MIIGYLLVETNIILGIRNLKIIGWTTLIFGILLLICDQKAVNKKIENHLNYKSAIFIGFFQVLSLIPG